MCMCLYVGPRLWLSMCMPLNMYFYLFCVCLFTFTVVFNPSTFQMH